MSANGGGLVKFEQWVAHHGWLYWIALIIVLSSVSSIPYIGPLLFIAGAAWGIGYQITVRGRHLSPPSETQSAVRGSQPTPPTQYDRHPSGPAPRPYPEDGSAIPVVGTRHYQGWGRQRGHGQVTLVREPNNPYDPNSIAVLNGGTQIGHLPRERAAILAPLLDVGGQQRVTAAAFFDEFRVLVTLPHVIQPNLAPRPGHAQLKPVTPWGRGQVEFEIEFEADHRAEIAALYRDSGLPITGSGTVLNDLEATLTPSLHPNAPAVMIGPHWVGNLTSAQFAPYRPAVDRLAAAGCRLQVRARVWARDDSGKVRSNVRVYLPEVGEIDPPGPMPAGAHILLPPGRKIQVTEEDRYLSEVSALLGGNPQRPVVATLHIAPTMSDSRAAKERVEVRVYGEVVGMLTAHMSEHFVPLIKACDEEGVTVACRAIVKGNQIKADVELDAARAGDLDDDWIARNLYGPVLQRDAEDIVAAAAADPDPSVTSRPADMWTDEDLEAAPDIRANSRGKQLREEMDAVGEESHDAGE